MRARPGRRPPSTLPSLHTLQLRRLIDLYYAIDLTIRMLVILSRVFLLRVHVHSCDAQEARFVLGYSDLGSSILRPIELDVRYPAFLQAFDGKCAKVLVDWIAGTIVLVEIGLEIFSGGSRKELEGTRKIKRRGGYTGSRLPRRSLDSV